MILRALIIAAILLPTSFGFVWRVSQWSPVQRGTITGAALRVWLGFMLAGGGAVVSVVLADDVMNIPLRTEPATLSMRALHEALRAVAVLPMVVGGTWFALTFRHIWDSKPLWVTVLVVLWLVSALLVWPATLLTGVIVAAWWAVSRIRRSAATTL